MHVIRKEHEGLWLSLSHLDEMFTGMNIMHKTDGQVGLVSVYDILVLNTYPVSSRAAAT